jgi:hypothetical protein
MWYIVRVLSRRGVVSLRTWGQDSAHACENVVELFPYSMGFWVLDCYTA